MHTELYLNKYVGYIEIKNRFEKSWTWIRVTLSSIKFKMVDLSFSSIYLILSFCNNKREELWIRKKIVKKKIANKMRFDVQKIN